MHPQLFTLGPVTLHSYGVMVAFGVGCAAWYLQRRAALLAVTANQMIDLVVMTAVWGFVGARALYVAHEWKYFRENPFEIFAIWHGGVIFYGGMLASLAAFWWQTKRLRVGFLRALDLFVPAIALAHAFGRIGCFFNGCCYGKPGTLFCAVRFPFSDVPRHPTQLYEALFDFSLFALLAFLHPRLKGREGIISFLYFVSYAIGRFGVEFLRDDMPRLALGWTFGQWISVGILISAFLSVLLVRRRHAG